MLMSLVELIFQREGAPEYGQMVEQEEPCEGTLRDDHALGLLSHLRRGRNMKIGAEAPEG